MKNINKKIIAFSLLFIGLANAQIGIGNLTPKATLDLNKSSYGTNEQAGIAITKQTAEQILAMSTSGLNAGTLVYATSTSGSINAIGYWNYNGSSWEQIKGTNLYSADGSLTSSRNVYLGSNSLTFNGGGTVNKLSGSADGASFFQIGRTSFEMDFGVAGQVGQGLLNTNPGDVWFKAANGNLSLGTFANTATTITTNGTQRMIVTGGGNVGIGTTNPQSVLDITGGTPIENSASPSEDIFKLTRFGTPAVSESSAAAFALGKYQAGNEAKAQLDIKLSDLASGTLGTVMSLLANGMVGIGTASPSKQLHIVGEALVSSLAGSGNRMVVADASGVLFTTSLPPINNIYNSDDSLTSDRTVTLGTNNLTLSGAGSFRIAGNPSSQSFSMGGTGVFGVDATGVSNGRFIILENGNIGIGSTSPDNKLSLQTTATNDGFSVSGPNTVGNTNKVQLVTNLTNGAYNPIVQSGDAGVIYDGSASNTTKGFVIAPWSSGSSITGGIRMDNSGNVGIGIINPSERLHIDGNVKITSLAGTGSRMVATDENGRLYPLTIPNGVASSISSSNGSNVGTAVSASENLLSLTRNGIAGVSYNSQAIFALGKYNSGSNSFSSLEFKLTNLSDSDFATVMTMNSNGNIGIGTNSPGSRLAVVGLPVFSDNTAAASLSEGSFYRTASGVVMVKF